MKVKVMSNNYASDKQVLRNAFPKWAEGEGIFSEMTEMPWSEEVDGVTLDIEYFGNRSGLKFCSPLVYNFLDKDGAVTTDGRAAIARVLKSRFFKPWKRLWDTYTAEYDPLENYQMQEDETRNLKGVNAFTDDTTGSETLSNTDETNGTDTITRTGTVDSIRTEQSNDGGTTEGSETLKTQNQRNGFNSIAPVDTSNVGTTNNTTGETTATHSGNSTDKVTNDLQDKNVRSDTVTSNGSRDTTKNLSHSGNSSEDEIITRKTHGFNGHLYTYQRLLSQERELWMWDYFEKVFQDVDRVLSLAIFDPCRVQSTGLYSGGAANQYVLPVANNSILGGVRGPSKTNGMIPVQIDGSGRMFVPPYPVPEEYNLPVAGPATLGGVKAAAMSNASVPVQVDSDGTLYVPEGGIKEIPVATSESVGGIKLPSEPSGDGEEISTKNAVQFVVDKTLSPEGGYKDDDTVSVVIPYAGQPGMGTVRAGLIKPPTTVIPIEDPHGEYGGTLYPVVFPYEYYNSQYGEVGGIRQGAGYVAIKATTEKKLSASWDGSWKFAGDAPAVGDAVVMTFTGIESTFRGTLFNKNNDGISDVYFFLGTYCSKPQFLNGATVMGPMLLEFAGKTRYLRTISGPFDAGSYSEGSVTLDLPYCDYCIGGLLLKGGTYTSLFYVTKNHDNTGRLVIS